MAPPAPNRPTAPPPARRLRGAAAALVLLAAAGAGAWGAAGLIAQEFEQWSVQEVEAALREGGFGWARVAADGLRITLDGTAPDEVQRFRAVARAGTAVDAARIRDRLTVRPQAEAPAPDFRVELLRTGQGLSALGRAPAGTGRAALIARLEALAGTGTFTDLLDLADGPAPPGWDAALDFALNAAAQVPQGKLTVTPDRVGVTAITDGPTEKARLEAALRRDRPEGVALDLDISAPRPVISPFALRMVKDRDGLRIETCAADSDSARDRIARAAAAAGAAAPDCAVGLGAPSPLWADAVTAAIDALSGLPAGMVGLVDTAVSLSAPATVPPPVFRDAAAGLERALPPAFGLTATLEQPVPAPTAAPADFTAEVTPDGVRLRGRITDERMRTAVESFARARFGAVDSDLRVDADAPAGWTVRVIAALEAMGDLRRGTAEVTPELIRLSGVSGSPTAAADAAQRLGARLGAGARYALSIGYDRRLDASSGLPGGADCVAGLNAALRGGGIAFQPGRAVIAGDPAPALARLAGAMPGCADVRMEIGAHTDSQGSESFNQDLSRSRAQAVLALMHDAGIPVANLTARGYGESQPLFPNDTEAGRQGNRRIDFTLLPQPARPSLAPVPAVTGVTAPAQNVAPAGADAPPLLDRLAGPPPDLGGPKPAAGTPGAAATLAVRPGLFRADPGADGDAGPTPDDLAGQGGLVIRPRAIEATGDRVTTPVPPPLTGPIGPLRAPGADILSGDGNRGLGGPDLSAPENRPAPRPAR